MAKPTIFGALQDPQFRRDVAQGINDAFMRGAATIPGGFVDIATMLMRPLGYKTPDRDVVMSSEWLGKKMEEAGLVGTSRNPAAEFLAALVTPSVVARGAQAIGSLADDIAAAPTKLRGPGAGQRGGAVAGGGKEIKATYPQAEALETARKNAVKSGLSENPEVRALQLGNEFGWYHGTTGDIGKFRRDLLGESTGAESAKKAFFFARDPVAPPEAMRLKAPANSESVQMLKKLGIPDDEIAKLNQVSFEGHGAETASGYSALGGSRQYKEAMRKANAAEKAGKWDDYEKWMQVAEDAEISNQRSLQTLVSKYGDTRDVMLDRINNAILSRPRPQEEAVALDAKMKQLMPYGWYNSYSIPQLKALKKEIADLAGDAAPSALKSIDDFIAVKAERALAEGYQEGSNVLPVALRYKNPMVHDFGGSSYRDQTYSDLVDKAMQGGHDALILRNTYDPGAGPAKLIDVAAVFDPSQVRSRFAAFDPARVNENDLLGGASLDFLKYLAAISGGGVLGAAALSDKR